MEPGVPIDEVKAPTNEFFERAKARLNREVTPALTDFEAPVRIRGDLDLDPALWEKAGVKATRPAAVLVPVVARPEPAVLLTEGGLIRPGYHAELDELREDRKSTRLNSSH